METERALARRRTPEEYEHALGIIRAESEGMSRLVNDLLTLARMDAGQAILRPEALDLSAVVLEVVERLTPLARGQSVALSTGELPELIILGDWQYLAQMLTNLVEDAIKYAVGENKWVRVETGCHIDESRAMAWIRVADNGQGISVEHLPHVFERFYRVDQARTRPSETERTAQSGSGLGLSIVQWIARAHGGQVSVSSGGVPGEGSVFKVSLPVKKPGMTE